VLPLFGVDAIGGLSDAMVRKNPPLFYALFPGTEGAARGLHATLTLSALTLTLGFFTRTSALVLLLASAQWSMVLAPADRGIDTLCRNILFILVFADAGATWSIDAIRRHGSWSSAHEIGSWARRLIIAQLVLMYFMAGVQKSGVTWYPMGNFAALYFVLQDPAIARFDFTWLEHQPWFFFTQLGTAGTIVFQDTYPLVFLWIWYRMTPERGGWLRRFSNRWRLEWWWIGTGALFHLLLAASCELGIFPWAMLALYPAWVHPDALKHTLDRVKERLWPR
jgi:hypothetical protein